MAEAAIELVGIDKSFGPVHANRDINLEIQRGTIHGIVGENGAGKSTLMSILYGFYQADSGEIRVDGKPIDDPRRRTTPSPPASAWSTSTSCWSRISRCSRTSCSAPRAARCSSAGIAKARARAAAARARIRARGRSRRDHRGAAGRPAAARRDPEGALSRRRHPDPRRADRRADAGRGRSSLPHPRAAEGAGQDDHPDHPQAARDHGDHRRGLGDAPGRDGGDAQDHRRPRPRNSPS